MECKEVKAVVSVGCCYNLLSEEGFNHVGSQCGFPMSCGVISAGISLGKSSRDLACQVNLGSHLLSSSSLIATLSPPGGVRALLYFSCLWNRTWTFKGVVRFHF